MSISFKGKELTNNEATPQKYEDWKELFLEFELSNTVDNTKRTENKLIEK